MRPICWPGSRSATIDHRGARLRLFAGGDGPPLLLIHGYGGAAWNFSELAPLLPGRSLLIPDLPGHAGSSPLPAAPGLAAYADAVAACLAGDAGRRLRALDGRGGRAAARRAPARARPAARPRSAAGISSSTRGAGLTISLAGIVQPGRIAGRRAGRIARSPRLRWRLVLPGPGARHRARVRPADADRAAACRPSASRPDAAHRCARRRRALMPTDPRLDRAPRPRSSRCWGARPAGTARGRLRIRPPAACSPTRDRRLRAPLDLRASRGLRRAALDSSANLCPLGVWRSLVARSVRVGRGPEFESRPPTSAEDRQRVRRVDLRLSLGRWWLARRCLRRRLHDCAAWAGSRAGGISRLGGRYGLELDPAPYDDARARRSRRSSGTRSSSTTRRSGSSSPQRIIEGMGGVGDTYGCAAEMTQAWEHAENFDLFDDVLPDARRAARPRAQGRAALEHRA